MNFSIQVSNPKTTGTFDPEDTTLDECVESAFLLDTEMAVLNWFGVFVPLSYKYSISTMLADVLIMLQTLLHNDKGEFEVTWPSSDFNSRWIMSWDGNALRIEADWQTVIGNTEVMLNALGKIETDKAKFISEWKALLEAVLNGLSACGYSESTFGGISDLKGVCSRIEEYGVLYR